MIAISDENASVFGLITTFMHTIKYFSYRSILISLEHVLDGGKQRGVPYSSPKWSRVNIKFTKTRYKIDNNLLKICWK